MAETDVRDLHRKVPEDVISGKCEEGNCDHDEVTGCPDFITIDICQHCTEIRANAWDEAPVQEWPCPTIEALDRAGGGPGNE